MNVYQAKFEQSVSDTVSVNMYNVFILANVNQF